ncbi:MAG: hypothetical protein HYZ81_16485, partial [Nitrospinae bacterium]|nr:hypothetical protein [Nitrospinota bacterium]
MKVMETGLSVTLLVMARLPAQARVLFAVFGAMVWLGSAGGPAYASPTLALSLNQTTVRPGDTLHVGLTARNPGAAFPADFYFGVVVPDGVTVVFLTSLSPLNGGGSRLDANPTTFQPLLTTLLIPAGLDVTLTDVLSLTFSQGLPPGTYVFFVALTPPRAFSDGRIDAGDILAIDAQALSFSLGTQVGPSFPIATTPLPETSFTVAFDGTNFLVGMASTQGTNAPGIGAQLVSPSGTVVGPPIFTGRFGGEPVVTFDGTNYLLVWGDTAPGNTGVFGQFVSPSGAFVGSPFTLSQAVPRSEGPGDFAVAFDGTNYFVIWTDARRSIAPDRCPCDIFGQRVSKAGTLVGGEIKVSGAAGLGG